MAEKVLMLALSPTMEAGTIARWIKKEGEEVSTGDILCEVETDKATMEYESIQEGTLLSIIVPEGSSATVEQPIAIIGAKGEDFSELVREIKVSSDKAPSAALSTATAAPAETPAAETVAPGIRRDSISPEGDGRRKSSPLARRLAREAGISLDVITGSGPGGRIVKRDIELALGGSAASTPASPLAAGLGRPSATPLVDETIPVSMKRKIIAERLAQSMYTAPHFYLKTSVYTETMMDARAALNATLDYKVSVNAFVMKFSAEAIKKHPEVNSSWQGETIRRFANIDIGLAVAQNDGLITPIVRDCGSKGVIAIDRELSDLIARAKTNKLAPEEYSGATFSISGLGTFGIEEFTAIINPPGSAILAVGMMKKVPVVDESDRIIVRSAMKLTLSCDHRVIDGVTAAGFLTDLKALMENPIRALY